MNLAIIDLFSDYFWATATQFIQLVTPIIGIMLIFRLIHDLIYKERF